MSARSTLISGLKSVALVVCSLVIVAMVRIALTLASHRTVLRALPGDRRTIAPDPLVWRAARAVSLTARLIPKATCLTQALALQLILGFRGHASELRIGVKHGQNGVTAHAWLLSDGKIAIGGSPQDIDSYVLIAALGVPKA